MSVEDAGGLRCISSSAITCQPWCYLGNAHGSVPVPCELL
jgi:hypothetical protein